MRTQEWLWRTVPLPDGPVGVDFCFHVVPSGNFSVVSHSPHGVVLHDSTRLKERARSTLVELLAPWNQRGFQWGAFRLILHLSAAADYKVKNTFSVIAPSVIYRCRWKTNEVTSAGQLFLLAAPLSQSTHTKPVAAVHFHLMHFLSHLFCGLTPCEDT